MSKLRSIDPQDIGAVLRALEQGRLKLKPSNSEKAGMSPAESKESNVSHGRLAKSVKSPMCLPSQKLLPSLYHDRLARLSLVLRLQAVPIRIAQQFDCCDMHVTFDLRSPPAAKHRRHPTPDQSPAYQFFML
ncbi:hypothetical protein PMG11_11336 [Penicillium brasilianum]|uniref:Uncharacterized protein n=1 Tax=Penicillium brasilianum TaxID=104259 RepID=A0A0F7U3J4_PENBI|nr:hypothetical protein PMG11_11336 [Penicillium brasilianum]